MGYYANLKCLSIVFLKRRVCKNYGNYLGFHYEGFYRQKKILLGPPIQSKWKQRSYLKVFEVLGSGAPPAFAGVVRNDYFLLLLRGLHNPQFFKRFPLT